MDLCQEKVKLIFRVNQNGNWTDEEQLEFKREW